MTEKRFMVETGLAQGLAQERESVLSLSLGAEGCHHALDETAIAPRTNSNQLSLSYAQQAQWSRHQQSPHNPSENVCATIELTGHLLVSALTRSLNEICRRHEIFRTTFKATKQTNQKTTDEHVTQVIAPHITVDLPTVNLQDISAAVQQTAVKRFIRKAAQQTFDLTHHQLFQATLLCLNKTTHVLVLVLHRSISDSFTLNLFRQELETIYEAFSHGEISPLPELPIQYADYAIWQRQQLQGDRRKTLLNYWQQQLAGMPTGLTLPCDRLRPPEQTCWGDTLPFHIDRALTQQLKTLSQASGTTLFMTLQAAFNVLLYRYSGQSDIVVGSPIAHRNRPELKKLMGFFENTLMLRTQISEGINFHELLAQVKMTTLGAYTHQDTPFEVLVEALQPTRTVGSTSMYQPFQVMFSWKEALLLSAEEPNERPKERANLTMQLATDLDTGIVRSDLDVQLWEETDGIKGRWGYSTDVFERATIQRMTSHFHTLLAAIVSNPAQQISRLPLLSHAERRQILVDWNDAQVESYQDQCVHERFEAQVAQSPHAIALVCETESLTYAALNSRANQLAHHLKAAGIGPEKRVGVYLTRSVDWVVTLLGILKAGGVYVPIDPAHPTRYVTKLLAQSQPPVLITTTHIRAGLPMGETYLESTHPPQVIDLDADREIIAQRPQRNLPSQARPGNLMYVMAFSESDIQAEHCNVSRRLDWLQTTFSLSTNDSVLCQSSPIRDVIVRELFWPLITGARVVLATAVKSPADLLPLMITHRVSVAGFVPSTLALFMASLSTETLNSAAAQLDSLRLVLFSGEPLSQEIFKTFSQHYSGRVYNLFNLPEAAGEITAFNCQSANGDLMMPVGIPTYRSVYVLDTQLQPVPMGVVGEIYIDGIGLDQSNIQCDVQAASRFVDNPFSYGSSDRLFKTGEFGRLRDGELERVGSLNRHVWLKGFRVNLTEIETALRKVREVTDCCVLLQHSLRYGPQLIAYTVLAESHCPEKGPEKGSDQGLDQEIDRWSKHLSNQMQAQLPSHLLPSIYVLLHSLPLTPTGDINEQALASLSMTD